MENFGNIETIMAVCVSAGVLCALVVIGGGFFYLFNKRDRNRRQAAQGWGSTTGRVIDSRVAHRAYFQLGITEEEAQARVKQIKDNNKAKPVDALASVLSIFGDAGELAGDLITDGGVEDTGEWPLVVYEYEV